MVLLRYVAVWPLIIRQIWTVLSQKGIRREISVEIGEILREFDAFYEKNSIFQIKH